MAEAELVWLDDSRSIDGAELAVLCRLQVWEVAELVEYGALAPQLAEAGLPPRFGAGCVGALREAVRLRSLFDLDLFTTGLLLRQLQRIEQLELQVRSLQAQLPTVLGRRS
jgi:hypothetical protein